MMKLRQSLLWAGSLILFVAGCSSPSPTPSQVPPPPVAQTVTLPPGLDSNQMAKLCNEAPDACQRVQTAQPLSLADVKAMAKVGFNSDLMIAVIRNSHSVYHLTANDIIDLNHAGIGNSVVSFMISTPSSVVASSPVPEDQTSMVPPPGTVPPPAPQIDITPPPSPGPDYVWVDGDWAWNGTWVWVAPHWVVPPYPGAIWYHHGWVRGGWGRGYYRRRDHWR